MTDMMEMVELSSEELDAVAAGTNCGCGDKNQGNQVGLVNVNVQDNNVAIGSAGFIQS
jgi:hypothetical protein